LQANRILGAHVATMMLSYAALSVSFGAAAAYLVQAQSNGGARRFARLPSGETLDEIANRSVLVGFPLLTLGVSLGAYWAYSAWGRYWGWDPKETSALVTWLIYAGYLHARNLRGWKGRGAAWLLVAGFGAVLFTYFAVNLWVSGLHSYAGV
jgi:cytochrome c-type biogenesis protein CcsB